MAAAALTLGVAALGLLLYWEESTVGIGMMNTIALFSYFLTQTRVAYTYLRLLVFPYAQVHGWRGYTSVEERLRHDLYYVRNRSLVLDMKNFFATLLRGWSERTRGGVPN